MICLQLLAPVAPAAGISPDLRPGLEALRAGRFDEAGQAFSRITAEDPVAPEGPFFEAFHLWWRLIDHPDNHALRLAMEERLREAGRRARLLLDDPELRLRERARIIQGVALLLDAQSKASRGSHLSAASLVRQGHRALSDALKARPGAADALFSMGAYNYYADRLPPLVKGIRFLLFIPGGDAATGIAQLEQAGESSTMFGIESLMLLSHIYSGGYEEDYRRALGYVEKASARAPGSPLISLARADLLYKLGMLREASDLAVTAIETIRTRPGYPVELERALSYRAAACTLKLHDPLGALERIEAGLRNSLPESPAEKKRWVSLWADAARDAGRFDGLQAFLERLSVPENLATPVRRRAAAAGSDRVARPRAEILRSLATGSSIEEGIRGVQELLRNHPEDTRLRYDLGRLLQQQGRFAEARPYLEAAAETKSSSMADLAGWAMVRLGWQLEQEGKREDALELYRRAVEMKQFTFQPSALDRLAHPEAPQPQG